MNPTESNIRAIFLVLIVVICLIIGKKCNAQTTDEVLMEITCNDIKHPDIVLRQAIWETGWFNCKKCSFQYNNLFGFTTKRGLMKFSTWHESIEYYKRWQDKYYDQNRFPDYYQFLLHIKFASSPKYIKNLKSLEY